LRVCDAVIDAIRDAIVEIVFTPNTISLGAGVAHGALTCLFGEAHALSVLLAHALGSTA
jgi:hypothetical protein